MITSPLQVIVGCECSGAIRREIAKLGHFVVSVDIKAAEDDAPHLTWRDLGKPSPLGYQHQGDLFSFLEHICHPQASGALAGIKWHLGIFHPDCTYLANSGVQWLHHPDSSPTAKVLKGASRWNALDRAAWFYRKIRGLDIAHKAIENPVMHEHAVKAIADLGSRDIVQPWMFGDKALKATGWELFDLPPLVPTSTLRPPVDPAERKKWAHVHNAAPTKDPEVRKANRSRTYPGMAAAVAQQWCAYVQQKRYAGLL